MADKPQINPKIQEDGSIIFDTQDGITVRVASSSPTEVVVEMWRETDTTFESVPPDTGNIGKKTFREKLAQSAREVFNPPSAKEGGRSKETVPNLDEDLGKIATVMGIPEMAELVKARCRDEHGRQAR
jgi:hypothetical protein